MIYVSYRADIIKAIRKQLGLSLIKLSKATGISSITLHRLENNFYTRTSIKTLEKLILVYNRYETEEYVMKRKNWVSVENLIA